MYLYLYDSFLNDKKHHSLLAKMETRLTDLGIGGKIFRLSPLRNIAEIVKDECRVGAKTVVVVGNDKTFSEVLNVSAELDVTLGMIPIGNENSIAKLLGVNTMEEACNIIAARKIEKADLGLANTTYFINHITLEKGMVAIECDKKFRIIPHPHDNVLICNMPPSVLPENSTGYFKPNDGALEIYIQPPMQKSGWGFFKKRTSFETTLLAFETAEIKSKKSLSVTTDGGKVLKTPVNVKILPEKVKLIVSKHRAF